jgi:putative DNA primase/helicase
VVEELKLQEIYKKREEKFREELAAANKVSILRDLAPSLSSVTSNSKWRGSCPNPGHKQTSGKAFRLFDDAESSGGSVCNTCGAFPDVVETLKFANGWDYQEVFAALRNYLGLDGEGGVAPTVKVMSRPVVEKKAERYEGARKALNRVRERLGKADIGRGNQIAINYFESRGLNAHRALECFKGDLRVSEDEDLFHEAKKGTYEKVGSFPALFVLYKDAEGRPATYHRIYLEREGHGKAKVIGSDGERVDVKRSMKPCRPMRGGFMELNKNLSGNVLGVTEGVETGLSIATLMDIRVRACSAGLKKYVDFGDDVEMVIDFVDADVAGLNDSNEIDKRCASLGIKYVRAVAVPVPGLMAPDWLDVLNHYGESKTKDLLSGYFA